MAADLPQLHSFLRPPPARELSIPKAVRNRFEHFFPLVGEQGSLCSSGSDSSLCSPLASSETLTSSDEDNEYLAELTRQMAYNMLREQDDEDRQKPGSVAAAVTNSDMPVDLFAISPQSTLWSPSGWTRCGKNASIPASKLPRENSGTEGDRSWNTATAYEPRVTENSNKIKPVQTKSCLDQNRRNHDHKLGLGSNQTLPNDRNWTKESNIRTERVPKQANSAKRKPHAKNNQWRTRRGVVQGECYVGLSLPHQQKAGHPRAAGSDTRAVFLRDHPNSRTGSTGTGVFLPKTAGNPTTEQGRKPRCSTVLIPARVAQALMVHFSKMSHQSRSSVGGGGGGRFPLQPDASVASGACPYFQQKGQAELEPKPVSVPEPEAAVNCNEMGLPQEWMY